MDALLAAFARHLGVSPEAARPALYALLDRLREGLDRGGPIALDGVGTWTDGGARFEPDAQLLSAVNRAYAGLAPVSDAPTAPAAPAVPLPAAPAAEAAPEPTTPGGVPLVTPSPVPPVVGGAPPAAPFATPFGPDDSALEPYDEVPEGTPVAAPLDVFDVPVGSDPFAEFDPNAPAEAPTPGELEADETDAELDALIAGVWAAPSPPSALDAPPSYEEAAPDETPEPPAPPVVAAFVPASSLTTPSYTPPAVAAVRDDERPPEPPPRRRSPLVFLLPLAFIALVALAFALWNRVLGDEGRTAAAPPEPAPTVALVVPDTAAAADSLLPADTVAGDMAVANEGLPVEAPPATVEPATTHPAPTPPARTEAPAPRPAAPRPAATAPRPEPPAPAPERPAYTPAPATPEATAAPTGASPFGGGGEVDPAAGGVTWIVNSTTSANARMQAERYRAQGFRAGVVSAVVGGRTVWRVALGQFASVAEAEAARSRLPADARADAWILRLGR